MAHALGKLTDLGELLLISTDLYIIQIKFNEKFVFLEIFLKEMLNRQIISESSCASQRKNCSYRYPYKHLEMVTKNHAIYQNIKVDLPLEWGSGTSWASSDENLPESVQHIQSFPYFGNREETESHPD